MLKYKMEKGKKNAESCHTYCAYAHEHVHMKAVKKYITKGKGNRHVHHIIDVAIPYQGIDLVIEVRCIRNQSNQKWSRGEAKMEDS